MVDEPKITDTGIMRALAKAGVPSLGTTLSTSFGVPLSIVIVWILQAYVITKPMPNEVAAALGALIVGFLAYALPGGRKSLP